MNFIYKILQSIYKNLFYLIAFLIPTQLAYHFWPKFSFVYGLRIDYLAVTVYFTDILIFLYVFSFLLTKRKEIMFSKKNILRFFVFLSFVLLNIIYSKQKELSTLKWLKIFELLVFAFVVAKDKSLSKSKILRTFCYSTIFFGAIGIAQIIKGSTLGGIFYYFGERSFTSATPGISLLNISNLSLLKPYSTFSHPNSLAGYILVILIFLLSWQVDKNKDKYLKYLTFIVIVCLLAFSYSKVALFALLIILLISLFKSPFKLPRIKLFTYLIVFISIIFPIISDFLLKYKNIFSDNVLERLMLSKISGQILTVSPFFGVGLNNFISFIPSLNVLRIPFWLLQPVHNIFLLLTVETGLFGIGIFFVYFFKYLIYLIENKKRNYLYILIAVFLTGFFDHYWFTIQQNMLLIFLFLGLSKNDKIK